MRTLAAVLVSAFLAAAQSRLSTEEAAQGWILLFDGESTFGWTSEGGAEWKVVDGALVAETGQYGWLRHNAVFADFELQADFRTAADGNSGIFLRSNRGGSPHVSGYELQIFDGHEKYPTGSIVAHAAAKGAKIKGGEWQTFHVTARGPAIEVRLDGNAVLKMSDRKSPAGHIGLQFNPGKKIEFRNVRLRPLAMQQIIESGSLKGWKKVEPPKPPQAPAEWSAREGGIHVEKGPGQLETERVWKDFVLQLEIRANPRDEAHHPNSGVFLRGTPGVWWSGYESQIRNEHEAGLPDKPVDFGTGGIYRSQPTRRIVARDGEFFTKTVVAHDRDFNVWVNGVPVTSWHDERPEGTNVRNKEAVLKPGTLSLQAHDPTTNLDFRNIRIAELPRPPQ